MLTQSFANMDLEVWHHSQIDCTRLRLRNGLRFQMKTPVLLKRVSERARDFGFINAEEMPFSLIQEIVPYVLMRYGKRL